MNKNITSGELQRFDIFCLNSFPYKPFIVTEKTPKSIIYTAYPDKPEGGLEVSFKEFDKQEHILLGNLSA